MRAEYNKGRGKEEAKPVQLPKAGEHLSRFGYRYCLDQQSVMANCLHSIERFSYICLPLVQVTPEMLKLLLEYCQFHRAAGRSDKVSLSS